MTLDPVARVQPRLILASGSERRQSLMREYGYSFETVLPTYIEPSGVRAHPAPEKYAEELSLLKAKSVADSNPNACILSGDTIVSLRNRIFGKPTDRQDARDILSTLSGTTHRVITAVTLLDTTGNQHLTRHDVTLVTMCRLTEAELEGYLDTQAWEGKAGAFGIQDKGDAFIERIEGSFTNVVGFPMELVIEILQESGYVPICTRNLK